jgi:hypothetical protein
MGVTMKKAILAFIVFIPTSIIGLAIYAMATDDIEGIVICAINDDTNYIPSSVCEFYLYNYRFTKEDISYLENRGGLSFPIGIHDETKRYNLVKLFISKDVSVNKKSVIDGYTPLHSAIIHNDPRVVSLLLSSGADINKKDSNQNMTPDKFLEFLLKKQPNIDRGAIKRIFTTYNQ